AVVAGERVGVYPATGGVGRGGVDIVAPVVAGHFAPVHQGLEGSVVAEGPLVVQVEALAVGEEPVVRGWIVVPLGAVIVQQQAAVGDIGVVLMPGKLQAHGVGIVEAHAGLGHDVGHFVALVHEAVALAVGGDDAGEGVTGLGATARLQGGFAGFEGADPGCDQHAVVRGLGLVVDHAADGGR